MSERHKNRLLRVIGASLLTILGLCIIFGVIIFRTQWGTKLLLSRVIAAYDESVPARILISEISGTLTDGVLLRDVEITTDDGAPIIHIDNVRLKVSLYHLLNKQIHFLHLYVEGSTVFIEKRNGRFTFAFVAPDSPTDKTDNDAVFSALPFIISTDATSFRSIQLIQITDGVRQPLGRVKKLDFFGSIGDHVQIAVDQLNADLTALESPVHFSISRSDNVRITDKQGFTKFHIHTRYGNMTISTQLWIANEISARIRTDIVIPQIADLVPHLSGHMRATGTWTVRVPPDGTLLLKGSLRTDDCAIAGLHSVQLNLSGTVDNRRLHAIASLQSKELSATASYWGNIVKPGTMRLQLKGALPHRVLDTWGISGSADSVQLESRCTFSDSPMQCHVTFQGRKILFDKIKIEKISIKGDAAVPSLQSLSAEVNAESFEMEDHRFQSFYFSVQKRENILDFAAEVQRRTNESAVFEGNAAFGNINKLHLKTLTSTLYGIDVRSESALILQSQNNDLKLEKEGRFMVNGATIVIPEFEKHASNYQGEAIFRDVSLISYARFMKYPIRGILAGTLKLKGTSAAPQINLNGTLKNGAIDDIAIRDFDFRAEYRNQQANITVQSTTDNAPSMHIAAKLPLRLNLQTGALKYLTRKRSDIEWTQVRIDSEMLTKWVSLPQGVSFQANTAGRASFRRDNLSVYADITSTVSHPLLDTITMKNTIAIDNKEQRVSAQFTDKANTPVQVTAFSHFSLPGQLKNEFPEGMISVMATIGDCSVTGDVQLESESKIGIDATISNFQTQYIQPYFQQIQINGSLNGSIAVWLNPTNGTIRPMEDESWQLGWKIREITRQSLGTHMKLPQGVQFNLNHEGGIASDGNNLSTNGKVDGWVGYSFAGRFPVEMNYLITESSQEVTAQWMMPNAIPMSLEFSSAFDTIGLFEKSFLTPSLHGKLEWGQAALTVDGNIDDLENAALDANFNGIQLSFLSPYITLEDIQGDISGNAHLILASGVPRTTASVVASNIQGKGWTFNEIQMNANYEPNQLRLSVNGLHHYGENITATAILPISLDIGTGAITWYKNDYHEIRWNIPSVSLYPYRKMLGISDVFDITLKAKGGVKGNIESFETYATAEGNIRVPGRKEVPLEFELRGNNAKQNVSMGLQFEDKAKSTFTMEMKPDWPRLISGNGDISEIQAHGRFESDQFDLNFIELLPGFGIANPKGFADVNISFAGTLNNPLVNGSLEIYDGQFTVVGLGNRIHHVQGEWFLKGPVLQMKQLTFMSGRGKARMWGRLKMRNGILSGWTKLNAVRFPISITGLPKFELDTHADTSIHFNNRTLSVETTLERCRFFKPAQVRNTAKLIPSNEHVIVQQSDETNPNSTGINYQLQIRNKHPIAVTGKDIDTYWNADISVIREQGETRLSGNIDAVRGSFNLLQNVFTIETGQLTLSPTPGKGAYLQLSSNSNVTSHTVYLAVSGNLLRPKLKLSSSPALTEEQILSLLVSGSTQEDAEKSTGAITTLLALQYPEVHNLLYNRFGINQLKVETTSQGSTTLKAGKKVSRRSTVYTVVNPNPARNENDVELQVETSITDKTSVGTSVGEKSSSLGIYRKIPIPNPEPPSPKKP